MVLGILLFITGLYFVIFSLYIQSNKVIVINKLIETLLILIIWIIFWIITEKPIWGVACLLLLTTINIVIQRNRYQIYNISKEDIIEILSNELSECHKSNEYYKYRGEDIRIQSSEGGIEIDFKKVKNKSIKKKMLNLINTKSKCMGKSTGIQSIYFLIGILLLFISCILLSNS